MNSVYQERYWNMLVEARVHVFFLYHYASSSESMDKAINAFLAITSSTSIAAWVIWKKFTLIWTILIAVSQIISAVKPFLPYNQRYKAVEIKPEA